MQLDVDMVCGGSSLGMLDYGVGLCLSRVGLAHEWWFLEAIASLRDL